MYAKYVGFRKLEFPLMLLCEKEIREMKTPSI